jgi:D-alanyl-lipoteichoic acid acyltransferase DltB (MBOAT superfamily)
MNTIFDYVGAILHTKNSSQFTSIDNEQSFQPFMVNRWISMYSPEMTTVVNTTMNKYATLFKNKQELFRFYVSVFPKLRNKRIAYIKKTKEQKPKESKEDDTALLAQGLELSRREIEMYKDLLES